MTQLYGSRAGIAMFVASALVAVVGGALMRLPDPIVMAGVGLALFGMDMAIRLHHRSGELKEWLLGPTSGGTLFFLPVWCVGLLVIALNIVNMANGS